MGRDKLLRVSQTWAGQWGEKVMYKGICHRWGWTTPRNAPFIIYTKEPTVHQLELSGCENAGKYIKMSHVQLSVNTMWAKRWKAFKIRHVYVFLVTMSPRTLISSTSYLFMSPAYEGFRQGKDCDLGLIIQKALPVLCFNPLNFFDTGSQSLPNSVSAKT